MLKRLISKAQSPAFILGLGFLFLLITCAYPFWILFYRSFFSGPSDSFTLKFLVEVFSSESSLIAIKNTVLVSACTSILSLVMALPLGWLLTRTNLPYKRWLRTLFCFPYAIQPYIGAIAWIYLANPSTGLLNHLFGNGFFNIYTFGGLIWVMSTFFYTFILLILLASLDRMDPSLEEAARISGAGPARVFFQITIPLITPALVSGALLVGLAAAASFGVPAMIGNPARIFLMTTKIYLFQKMGSIDGIYLAGTMSIALLVLAGVVLLASHWIQKRYSYQIVSGKASRPSEIELGHLKTPALIGSLLALFVLLALPLGAMILAALGKVQGVLSWDNIGFQTIYQVLFNTHETGRAIYNSLVLSVGAATVATAVGMIIAYIQYKTKMKGRHLLDVMASLPYSTPGTVVALAFILAFSGRFLGVFPSLYNTLGIIWLAYMTKYISFAVRTTGDGFTQIHDSLAEAARVSGANWWTTLKTIWFPLMKASLVASWFLIFMPCFSELTMTILLTGPGIETIGTVMFQMQEYGDASGGGAAVLAFVVIFIVAIANAIVKTVSKGKYGL
ncbi:MAG: iron ABC transporter permease [Bdellovibrionales bacterium]|nr:iron ABC transporter permease [Bdellovibrionales bacterium]